MFRISGDFCPCLLIHGSDIEFFGIPLFFRNEHDAGAGRKEENQHAQRTQLFSHRYIEDGSDGRCGKKS